MINIYIDCFIASLLAETGFSIISLLLGQPLLFIYEIYLKTLNRFPTRPIYIRAVPNLFLSISLIKLKHIKRPMVTSLTPGIGVYEK